ncbi:sensor histidine kinase [Paenibacillus silviterrae]|uniref:sensor histidine kinase n=1 Tax=Paenibacillus silviterrae TaxID=3242194 RepID=UPI0025437C93|nr:sensor histidine kinase [Paenibacillus chinjuensis]
MRIGKSLAARVYLGVILVTVLAILLLGVGSYLRSSGELEEQTGQYLRQMVRTAAHQTDLYFKTYEYAATTLLINTDLRRFFEIDKSDYDYVHYYSQVRRYALQPTLTFYPQINFIAVIGEDGRYIAEQREGTFVPQPSAIASHYRYLIDQIGRANRPAIIHHGISSADDRAMITIASKVRELRSLRDSGVVTMEIRASELSQLWAEVDLGEQGFFFIADKQGKLIYHPDEALIGTLLDERLLADTPGEGQVMKVKGMDRIFVSAVSEYTGWRLFVSLPVEDVTRPVSNIRQSTLWVGLFALVATAFVAFRFASSVTKPIQKLRSAMRQTELDSWQPIALPERQDEIAQLYQSYNHMVTRLAAMVDTVYKEKMERQTAEFQALQLQINPHFLYNTLTAVYGYAVEQEAEEIAEMSRALSFMFRYAVQTNLEEITVANELNHVLNFMIIMNHRNQQEFELEVLIPPSLLLEHMVRLTLQPLVENCLQHAFPEGIASGHYIRIDAKIQERCFLVTVEDNGIGVLSERLAEIQARLAENRLGGQGATGYTGGIGLMNVHRRIQMVFGEQYGLRIDSTYAAGTTITLVMPKQVDKLRR